MNCPNNPPDSPPDLWDEINDFNDTTMSDAVDQVGNGVESIIVSSPT